MQPINSFNMDRSGVGTSSELDYGADPASGGFFSADYKKHEDLKQMLDSNKDSLKLEAMKRIISMVAKGRDASELFPAVVKNVVSKNIEVKKLVYVFLMRYAEEQQDLALLSISTFQRALKDPNQLIRASALRVLSSIRVSIIVPIVMLAIRESASDMSPYVRKTAAHAIPKLYSLDPEQKEELVVIIERLLGDRTTLVVGSAVMAFDEVCPERVDLIHKNFRKLCNLLIDVDEWGQVIIINMLTRYARTQFANPNLEDVQSDGKFYSDASDDSDSIDSSLLDKAITKNSPNVLDVDHKLLLRQTKPLLQSRNAAVVMAVSQLFHHVAPRNEVLLIAKALIRHLRSYKEIQSVVLTCVASLTITRKYIFEPHLKSFFVRNSDPTHIKLLKLEILTNLATEVTISIILREFQTYIANSDNYFVAATIQAIGRCASSIEEISETCLNGLIHLLSSKNEHVVAESVVVIKRLLQSKAAENSEIISQMAKLLNFITIPAARASILWLIGEYTEKIPKIAPDVLRKLAKTFGDEENIVKMQILNLTLKLYLTNPENDLLYQYIFNLARYDQNYDIRDRARLLKFFIYPDKEGSKISTRAKDIFLSSKPYPTAQSKHSERDQYQLGSLSHYMNIRAAGYKDLPDFPEVPPDPSVRNIEKTKIQSNLNFSSDNVVEKLIRKSKFPDEEYNSESSDYSETSSESSTENSSGGEDDAEESDERNGKSKFGIENDSKKEKKIESDSEEDEGDTETNSGSSDESSSESENDSTSSSDEESEDQQADEKIQANDDKYSNKKKLDKDKTTKVEQKTFQRQDTSNLDLLLNLENVQSFGKIMTPTRDISFESGTTSSIQTHLSPNIELVSSSYIEHQFVELVNKVSGHGLEILYRYTRTPHLGLNMISIELEFKNHSYKELTNIHMGKIKTPTGLGISINEFPQIDIIHPMQTCQGILGVNFNDSTHEIEFEIIFNQTEKCLVTFKPRVGELVRSVKIPEKIFKNERLNLRGMNEHQFIIKNSNDSLEDIKQKIYKVINVSNVESSVGNTEILFAGQTITNKNLVLISIEFIEQTNDSSRDTVITVNCENVVLGSLLLNEIKKFIFA
ncbi:AP-3 complex subunit beta-2 [Condylostylus longicornis]|uniref:AP-3 complex subunit beta-2 n=1 Tax=Condylostylus longicornis TaxID=2530218 RepID=UPI00244E3C47|nr:AP-3 complex subunit beta-2 [Condylostylus longicornis]